MSIRPARAAFPLLLSLLSLPASASVIPTPGESAVGSITLRIKAGDCAGAVDWLKDGLKAEYREVELLAGTMYDLGLCVRRDWSRAVAFYAKAYAAGLPEGAERLAAGYADPKNGPDAAAALWWAMKGRAFHDPGCGVPQDAANDPDRFVAVLSSWTPQRLSYCNYVVGVMSTISSELRYPELAADFALGGDFTLHFLPAVPRVEVQKGEAREYAVLGFIDGDALRDRSSKAVARSIEKTIKEVTDRALKRYPQPAGIPANSWADMKYTFEIVYK